MWDLVIVMVIMSGAGLAWTFRQRTPMTLGIILGLATLPRHVITFGENWRGEYRVNLAGEVPALTAVDVAVLALLLPIAFTPRSRTLFFWILPGLLSMSLGVIFLWPTEPHILAGVVHLSLILAAWPIGRYWGIATSACPNHERPVSRLLLGFLIVQAAACVMQLLSGTEDGRTSGSFDHPGHLGKIVLVFLMILLPITQSRNRTDARIATLATLLGVIVTASTLSRANLISVIGALLIWALSTRRLRQNLSRRVIMPVAFIAVLVSAPFFGPVLDRFTTDLEGGLRPQLLEAGLRVISHVLWFGTGPNNFAEVAASTEAIYAQTGAPIHNSYLLLIGELGIFIALLFLLPALKTLLLALRDFRSGSARARLIARAVIATLFMIALAASSGWGFLLMPIGQILYLALGYSDGLMTKRLDGSHSNRDVSHNNQSTRERNSDQSPVSQTTRAQ